MIRKTSIYDIKDIKSNEILEYIIKGDTPIIICNSQRTKGFSSKFLKNDEITKMNKYRKLEDKNNFLISHSVVNYLFSSWIGCEIHEIIHRVSKLSKPYIDNDYGIHYNISHSNHLTVICFSLRRVGIDVEYIDNTFDYHSIAKYFFCKNEKEIIHNIETFLAVWVTKEAYLKRKGTGLSDGVSKLEVKRVCEKGVLIRDLQEKNDSFIKIFKFDNYIIAICND